MATRLKAALKRYLVVLIITLTLVILAFINDKVDTRWERIAKNFENLPGFGAEAQKPRHPDLPDRVIVSRQGGRVTRERSRLEMEASHRALWENGSLPDDRFTPMLELFQQKARGDLRPNITKFRNGTIPRILLWSRPFNKPFWMAQMTHIKRDVCPLPCKIIFDTQMKETADAIVIYLRGAKDTKTVMEELSPRDPRQPWIMLSFEATPNANNVHKTKYQEFNGLFNRTMFHRQDSDILLLFGFIIPRADKYLNVLPRSWVSPPSIVSPSSSHTKKLVVTLISNCHASSNRMNYIDQMQKHGTVDVFGRCGKLKCGHSMYVEHRYNVSQHECLQEAGKNYLFYLAFENNLCDDYFTERVFNLLYYPIVPVVRGQTDYTRILPPNSYIDASHFTPKELMEYLLYLQSSLTEYNKLLEWRKYYQVSTLGGERSMCYLCSRLYEPDIYKHKVIEDFEDWFVWKSRCMSEIKF